MTDIRASATDQALIAAHERFAANQWRAADDLAAPLCRRKDELGVRARLLRAMIASCRTHFKDADRGFRALRRDARRHPIIAYRHGLSLLERGALDSAIERLEYAHDHPRGGASERIHAAGALAVACALAGLRSSTRRAFQELRASGLVSARLLMNQGFIQAHDGRLAEAQQSFVEALEADYSEHQAFLGLTHCLWAAGKPDTAASVLEIAVGVAPESPLLWMRRGELAEHQGDANAALGHYQQALALAPNGEERDALYFAQARAYRLLRSFDRARESCRALLQHCPRSPLRAQTRHGLRALSHPDAPLKARVLIADYPRVVQRRDFCGPAALSALLAFWGRAQSQEDVAKAVFRQGTSFSGVVRYLEARDFMTRLFSPTWRSVKALIDAGVPVLIGEYRSADGHFLALIGYDEARDTLLAHDPNFLEAVELPRPAFERAARHAATPALCALSGDRLSEFETALPPDSAAYRRALAAEQLVEAGDYQRAAEECRALLDENMRLPAAWKLLIQAEMLARRFPKARALCQRALQHTPTLPWAWKYLGDAWWVQALQESGAAMRAACAEAKAAYAHARRLLPADRRCLLQLAEIAVVEGEVSKARRLLHALLRADFRQVRAHELLAALHEAAGQRRGAIRRRAFVFELEPDRPEARDRLAALQADHPLLGESCAENAAIGALHNELGDVEFAGDEDGADLSRVDIEAVPVDDQAR